ncbi:MAG: MerR family transcriptional regulator [Chloroflexota bacterium]
MTDEQHYTIGELAQVADVTPRTIRYYTAEGLLPPPDTRGRYALYNEAHLLRLRLIARLKDAYLPLSEIKARLENLSNEEMQQLLTTEAQSTPPNSASDYIAQVLGTRDVPTVRVEPPRKRTPKHSVTDQPTMRAQAPFDEASPEEKYKDVPPQPSLHLGYVESVSQETATQRPASLLSRLAPSDQTHQETATEEILETSERWQRIVLAPGVELHILEPITPEQHKQIERLVTQARTWLKDND